MQQIDGELIRAEYLYLLLLKQKEGLSETSDNLKQKKDSKTKSFRVFLLQLYVTSLVAIKLF